MVRNFPIKSGRRKECPLLPLFFITVLEILVNTLKQKKEIKGIRTGKEETKPSLLTNDKNFYVEICKNQQKPSTCNYSKVAGYKVNVQKSISFLYSIINKENLKLKTHYHLH